MKIYLITLIVSTLLLSTLNTAHAYPINLPPVVGEWNYAFITALVPPPAPPLKGVNAGANLAYLAVNTKPTWLLT